MSGVILVFPSFSGWLIGHNPATKSPTPPIKSSTPLAVEPTKSPTPVAVEPTKIPTPPKESLKPVAVKPQIKSPTPQAKSSKPVTAPKKTPEKKAKSTAKPKGKGGSKGGDDTLGSVLELPNDEELREKFKNTVYEKTPLLLTEFLRQRRESTKSIWLLETAAMGKYKQVGQVTDKSCEDFLVETPSIEASKRLVDVVSSSIKENYIEEDDIEIKRKFFAHMRNAIIDAVKNEA